MNDWKDDILAELLDCGYADLSVLEDCQYDMADIVEQCKADFGKIDLNRLAHTMFDFGRADIESKRLGLIDELESELNEWDNAIEGGQELTEEEQERYDTLKSDIELLKEFDVYENLESFHNYIDTSIWVTGTSDNERIRELLKDAFEEFKENTGYSIG
jgi:hypothetical protein